MRLTVSVSAPPTGMLVWMNSTRSGRVATERLGAMSRSASLPSSEKFECLHS